MRVVLEKLSGSNSLSHQEAYDWMCRLMQGEFSSEAIAGALMALKTKGVSSAELAGFAAALRDGATRLNINVLEAVDCCGTGGDGSGSFNISTAAGIVAAAAGVKVAKHGNRSVSSKCGSADILESAGIAIDPGVEGVQRTFAEVGICFMFAPQFHPAIKYAMPARKALGVRTVFNLLGPLLNPAGVKRQLLGVYSRELMPLFADSLKALGTERALIVHSADGLDEISAGAETYVIELKNGTQREYTLTPEEIGVDRVSSDSISGGGPERNLETLHSLFEGDDIPERQAVLANAGATAYLAKGTGSIRECVSECRDALDSGACTRLIERWKQVV